MGYSQGTNMELSRASIDLHLRSTQRTLGGTHRIYMRALKGYSGGIQGGTLAVLGSALGSLMAT